MDEWNKQRLKHQKQYQQDKKEYRTYTRKYGTPSSGGGSRSGGGEFRYYEGEKSPYWKPNSNLPSFKQLQAMARKEDPYVMSRYLDQVIFNKMAQDTAVFKDKLFESRSWYGPGSPSYEKAFGNSNAPEYEGAKSRPVDSLNSKDRQKELDTRKEISEASAKKANSTGNFFGNLQDKIHDALPAFRNEMYRARNERIETYRREYGVKDVWDAQIPIGEGKVEHVPMMKKNGKYVIPIRDRDKKLIRYENAASYYQRKAEEYNLEQQRKADEVNKKRQEEAEGGTSGFLKALLFVNKAGGKKAADLVTPDFIEDPAKWAGEMIINVLSTGAYTVNNTAYYLNEQDDDAPDHIKSEKRGNVGGGLRPSMVPIGGARKFLFGGRDPIGIGDDLEWKDVKGAANAAKRGFLWEDKRLFNEILAVNAAADPEKNIYDSKVYQGSVGILGDVGLDPITYMTFGTMSGVKRAALGMTGGATRKTVKTEAIASELADLNIPRHIFRDDERFYESLKQFDREDAVHLNAEEIVELMNGNTPKRFHSVSQRQAAANRGAAFVDKLDRYFAGNPGGKIREQAGQLGLLERVAKVQKARRDALVGQETAAVLVDDTKKFLDQKVKDGVLSEDIFPKLIEELDSQTILKALDDDAKVGRFDDAVPFGEGLGKKLQEDPLLAGEDFSTFVPKLRKQLERTDKEYKAVSKRAKGIYQERQRKKEAWEALKGSEDEVARARALGQFKAADKRYKAVKNELRRKEVSAVKGSLQSIREARAAGIADNPIDIHVHQGLEELEAKGLALLERTEKVGADKGKLAADKDAVTKLEGEDDFQKLDLDNPDLYSSDPATRAAAQDRVLNSGNYQDAYDFERLLENTFLSPGGDKLSPLQYRRKQNLSPVGNTNWAKMDTPEIFTKGQPLEDMSSVVKWNSEEGKFHPTYQEAEKALGRPFTDAEKDYIRRVAETTQGKLEELSNRAVSDAMRKRRTELTEVAQDTTTAQRFEQALQGKIPKDVDPVWKDRMVEAAGDLEGHYAKTPHGTGYDFVVEVDGKKVFYRGGKNIEGLTPTADDIEFSEYLVKHLDKDGQMKSLTIPKDKFETYAKALQDAGIPAPSNYDMFEIWLKNQHIVDGSGAKIPFDWNAWFSPEAVAFRREFESQSGMTIAEAARKREFLRSPEGSRRLVTMDRGQWGRERFRHGMTYSEFIANATKSVESLWEVLRKSKISVRLDEAKIGSVKDGKLREYVDARVKAADPDTPILDILGRDRHAPDSPVQRDKVDKAMKDGMSFQKARELYDEQYEVFGKQFADTLWDVMKADPERGLDLLQRAWRGATRDASYAVERKAAQAEGRRFNKGKAEGRDKPDAKAAREAAEAQVRDEFNGEAINRIKASVNPEEARKIAMSEIKASRGFDSDAPLRLEVLTGDTLAARDTARAIDRTVKNHIKEETKRIKEAKKDATPDEVAALDAELAEYRKLWTEQNELLKAEAKRVKQVKEVRLKQLREEAIFKVINSQIEKPRGSFTVGFAGATKEFELPTNQWFHNKMQRASDNVFVASALDVYSATFKPPKGSLPFEQQLMANRASANTANVIRIHLDKLRAGVGSISRKDRVRHWSDMRKGAYNWSDPDVIKVMEEFRQLRPYFNNEVMIGDSALTVDEISRFLPRELQLNQRARNTEITTPELMSQLFQKGTMVGSKNNKMLEDPLHLIWNVRIAVEQAVAHKALKTNISEMFGIKRAYPVKKGQVKRKAAIVPKGQQATETQFQLADAIEELTKVGWDDVPRLGNKDMGSGYLFPPEIIPDINRLLDLFEPRNSEIFGRFADEVIGKFKLNADNLNPVESLTAKSIAGMGMAGDKALKGYDKAVGSWKMLATIYNPGYYTRNLVGEVMVAWLGGVNAPKFYRYADKVVQYGKQSGDEIEQLLSHQPWAEYSKSRVPDGKNVLFQRNGQNITIQDVWVMYHDQGLKTGFVNTTFDEMIGSGSGKTKIGAGVGNVHQGVRRFGEMMEDWPRLAHFMHKIENAPKHLSLEKAMEYAAGEVRKYHFDYSDVSRFEQTVMARTFPFFKWTRKAVPLIAQNIFLKPGKINIYPKTMENIGNMTAADMVGDEDPNGFIPNYTGMVPGWIRDMGAYRMGRDPEGHDTYANLQTPQMDAIRFAEDPMDQGYTLLSPFIKAPLEQITGQTHNDLAMPVETGEQRVKSLARSTPLTNLIEKIANREDSPIGEPGGGIDETLWSFLTGVGLYENNQAYTLPDNQSTNDDPKNPVVVD